MIKLQSIAQLPPEPSQALSTQMSPPQGDSLILHHLPIIPLHSAFSPEHVCLPGSPSSWTSRHQSLAAWCVCWVCVYVVSVQMCMLGEEGSVWIQSPGQRGMGINVRLPLLLPSALLLVPLMSKPYRGRRRGSLGMLSMEVRGQPLRQCREEGMWEMNGGKNEESRVEEMWYLCPLLLLHPCLPHLHPKCCKASPSAEANLFPETRLNSRDVSIPSPLPASCLLLIPGLGVSCPFAGRPHSGFSYTGHLRVQDLPQKSGSSEPEKCSLLPSLPFHWKTRTTTNFLLEINIHEKSNNVNLWLH